MQYRLVALSALAASAFAQSSANSSAEQLASVVSVLETALPSSLVAEALTNAPAVSSQIVSEFAAGSTPSWYNALPSDVKTYLVPSGAAIINSANSTRPMGTGVAGNSTMNNSTMTMGSSSSSSGQITSSMTQGPSSTGGSGGSGSGSGSSSGSSSSSHAGAASLPTNIVGMGLAGAVGLVGILAL